ncbi:hypothetical protein PROVRUST_07716 [Providencia rustigianii DSM 4541]|uniref:Uncharacterized protein n=1 Tax=Providencia rustigianii DSM 4541 TaxID=500637 RepID=D1P652_9GAMM|nr:hypothetical protein PROVRUST_07716 [Providencia rustigianii DSM 4541]
MNYFGELLPFSLQIYEHWAAPENSACSIVSCNSNYFEQYLGGGLNKFNFSNLLQHSFLANKTI